jgi:acyl-CoA thioester hydrolase
MQPLSEKWFEYPVHVHAHHTDYAGVVWHGTYVSWLEEARGECLRSVGVEYADWVASGCELPVVELSIRYHQFLQMGKTAVVRVRMLKPQGIRLCWEHEIRSLDGQELYITAQVTLVAVERQSGKIMRRLPSEIKDTLARLMPEDA